MADGEGNAFAIPLVLTPASQGNACHGAKSYRLLSRSQRENPPAFFIAPRPNH